MKTKLVDFACLLNEYIDDIHKSMVGRIYFLAMVLMPTIFFFGGLCSMVVGLVIWSIADNVPMLSAEQLWLTGISLIWYIPFLHDLHRFNKNGRWPSPRSS